MGRELKRVPLDFDWPMNTIYQPFLDWKGCDRCTGDGYLDGPGADDLVECPRCKGSGEDPERPYPEVPAGEGYQIWETVSEGSPISPVFATPEALARWMTNRPWGADRGSSYEAWMRFITGPGWAPSGMMVKNADGTIDIKTGPEAI